MKILCITNEVSTTSGWGRYSLEMIEALKKEGHEVQVICHKRNTTISVTQYEVLHNPLFYLKNLFFKFSFIKNVLKFNPVIIHCMVETYGPFAWFLSRTLNRPYIMTVHGSFALKPFARSLSRALQTFVYKHAKYVVAVSNYGKARLEGLVPAANYKVINNGVGAEFVKNAHAGKKENFILGVGALKHRKGFHLSIEAFAKIAPQFPTYSYVIVGDDSDTKYVDSLREIIKKNNLQGRVIIKSNVTEPELKQLYESASVFVLTPISSKYDFEGFGLVYLEANAYGLPVIGTRDNGGEDAIVDGATGFLANPDVEDIAEKMSVVLSDKTLYNSLSLKARQYAEEMLWDFKIKEYLKLYQ